MKPKCNQESENKTRARIILSRNLKAYRMYFNLSQEKVSLMTGISIRGYGKIERGEVAPSLDTMDKLASGLGLSITTLLDESTAYRLGEE